VADADGAGATTQPDSVIANNVVLIRVFTVRDMVMFPVSDVCMLIGASRTQ
jgi:hypothetical protein